MPVPFRYCADFKKEDLEGINIGACLHVTAETANLMVALKRAGQMFSVRFKSLSTQDDVASLVKF